MQYCYPKKSYRYISTTAAIIGLCIGLCLIPVFCFAAADYFRAFQHPIGLGLIIFLIKIDIAHCVYSFLQITVENREYVLNETGITIRYLKHFYHFYPWSCINDICVCNINFTTRGPLKFDHVIRCVIGIEKDGPSSGKRKWENFEYSILHYNSVLRFSFSEERLEEFRKYSPIPIKDYTHDPRYLRWYRDK